MEKGLVHDIADLYDLSVEDLKELEGFADKSARKLSAAIDKTRKPDLGQLLFDDPPGPFNYRRDPFGCQFP